MFNGYLLCEALKVVIIEEILCMSDGSRIYRRISFGFFAAHIVGLPREVWDLGVLLCIVLSSGLVYPLIM